LQRTYHHSGGKGDYLSKNKLRRMKFQLLSEKGEGGSYTAKKSRTYRVEDALMKGSARCNQGFVGRREIELPEGTSQEAQMKERYLGFCLNEFKTIGGRPSGVATGNLPRTSSLYCCAYGHLHDQGRGAEV